MSCGMEIRQISKSFLTGQDQRVQALDDVTFDVPAGRITALLGPSGCGKSTLLHIIAGFDAPDAGMVTWNIPPQDCSGRRYSMVFQTPALFVWLTVQQNVEFALKRQKISSSDKKLMVEEILDLVGLREFAQAYPDELSGGMQQRVALARALVCRPQILLMDEPFSALDAQTREQMQNLLLEIQARLGQTILFVTHDIEEALRIASAVIVLSSRPGRVVKCHAVSPHMDDSTWIANKRAIREALL